MDVTRRPQTPPAADHQDESSAQHALHIAETRMSGILESAMDAIISIDAAQRVVIYNAAAEKIFRWPRAAVLGQPLNMLMPARFRAAHAGHVGQFGQTGMTSRPMGGQSALLYSGQSALPHSGQTTPPGVDQPTLLGLRANGEEFPIEASISQHAEDGGILFTVILRDITGRSRAEHLLARSEARLRSILDSALDAIITVNQEQHIVLFNAAAEQVFGCAAREAIGAPLDWFIPERFRAQHSAHVHQFGNAGPANRLMAAQRIVTGLRRDGAEFPIEASISHITEGGNKFYTVMLRDITGREQAQAALLRSREELREFAAAASAAREQEKSRIARELHDELAQSLTALKMDLNWISAHLPAAGHAGADDAAGGGVGGGAGDGADSGTQALAAKVAAMHTMLAATVAATRRIAADLRPLLLDDLGLLPAAEWLVQGFRSRTGTACTLDITTPDFELDEPYATAVFRILQESLTNAARHAEAAAVRVTLGKDAGHVSLVIDDNGRGFAITDPRKPASYGLMGLRERVSMLNGELKIDSGPGAGTRIAVRIPLEPPQKDAP